MIRKFAATLHVDLVFSASSEQEARDLVNDVIVQLEGLRSVQSVDILSDVEDLEEEYDPE